MKSREIFKDQFEFQDGSRVFAVACEVPQDPQHEEDIKIRFQYFDPGLDRDDKTILRYDNTHKREGHEFHKHVFQEGDEKIEPVEYSGDVISLYSEFLQEVRQFREQYK